MHLEIQNTTERKNGVEACFYFCIPSRWVPNNWYAFLSLIPSHPNLRPISAHTRTHTHITLTTRLRIHLTIRYFFPFFPYNYWTNRFTLRARVDSLAPYNILTASSLLWNSSSQDWYLCPPGGPAIVLLRKKRVTLLAPLQWPLIQIDNPPSLLILLIHPPSVSFSTTAEKINTYEHSRPSSIGTKATQ